MNTLLDVLLVLATLGTVYYVLSTFALLRHFRRDGYHAPPEQHTKISVLKPVMGMDLGAQSNLVSYLHQDYSGYEVLFGVLDATDPALPLLESIALDHPRAALFTGSDISGQNNKVRVLDNLAKHAAGDILIITDADTRANPQFLNAITTPFMDPKVGAVTCVYKGIRALTIAESLEGLHMTCVFAPGVASANALGALDFGLGAAIAVRREALDAIGGFESIVDYLADDFQLGQKVSSAGYRVVLSKYVIDITLGSQTMREVFARELRWSVTTRVSRPWGHAGQVFTFGFTYALLYAIAAGFSARAWIFVLVVATIRQITASVGAQLCLEDREFRKRAYLLPLRDILSFVVWIAGYFTSTVVWRGRRLRIRRNGMIAEG